MAEIGADLGAGGAGEWALVDGAAECWFEAPSHAAGAELIIDVARLAAPGPLPEFGLRRTGVSVRVPYDAKGQPPALTGAISDLARRAGLRPDPTAAQRIGITIESPHPAAVRGYWRLVCDYRSVGDELVDPLHRDPVLRFAVTDEVRPLRNRIHLDVDAGTAFGPDRLAELERVGGHVVRGAISADPDGNEVCIPSRPPSRLDDTDELADWRQLMGAMVRYPTAGPAQAAELAAAVAAVADDAGRPLIIDLRPGTVIIDSGKDQQEDERFDLDAGFREVARAVQAAARDLGLVAGSDTGLRHLQAAIDAADIPAVQRFWLAALGYRPDPRSFLTDIVDPRRRGPVMWFQQLEEEDEARRAQRNRLRLRLAVPPAQAPGRLAAALGAGGMIIDDTAAPTRWLVADPEGNELELVAG
ncbi:VOC family protein [Microlunatus sp. GCM10028923]|uniref:VOC family protein n=1 Tax=Microlunatus sp. GCM10028923 TaxID=3273400 RepID=UPI00361CAAC4